MPTYAGFWARTGATIIDIILMLIVLTIPTIAIYGNEAFGSEKIILGFWDFIINYVLPFALVIWLWVRFMGTPGKMALKLKIVNAHTGEKISIAQAIIRYFSYIISALPLGLGFLWIAFDSKKQGWHDKLAGTVVIKDNSETPVKFDSAADS